MAGLSNGTTLGATPRQGAAAGRRPAGAALGAGGIAALLSSACCLGPLVLVSLGVSGAWISNLTLLEPYRWAFIAAALGFMGYAGLRIYRPRPVAGCEPGTACALPQSNRVYRAVFWIVAALVLAAIVFPLFLPLFY